MSGKCAKEEDEEVVIQRQIKALREHIYSHIIWYLQISSIPTMDKATVAKKSLVKTLTFKCLLLIILLNRYDYEKIFYTLLRAADEAVGITRRKWTPSIGNAIHTIQLFDLKLRY